LGAGGGRTWAYGGMYITRVPEPATWALILVGLTAAMLQIRVMPARARSRQRGRGERATPRDLP
jgi:hypothetical protein